MGKMRLLAAAPGAGRHRPRRARPRLRPPLRCRRGRGGPRAQGLGGAGDGAREARGGGGGGRGPSLALTPGCAVGTRAPSWDGVCAPECGAGAARGLRRSRAGPAWAAERLRRRLGSSLGKGTAAFPRSRGRQPSGPGGALSQLSAPRWLLRQPEILRTPCRRGGPMQLNPRVSAWVVPHFWPSCETSSVGERET